MLFKPEENGVLHRKILKKVVLILLFYCVLGIPDVLVIKDVELNATKVAIRSLKREKY